MMLAKRNIRATTDKDFFKEEFSESVCLWNGAKHNLTLREIENLQIDTLSDIFASKEQIYSAHQYCKQVFLRMLPLLTEKLNKIHGLEMSSAFWRTVFGYWLFRHICIAYEKFLYLSRVEVNQTSIKLLDRNAFYVPNDHYDYLRCFSNDFGVMQLVSQYYYLYADKTFERISKECDLLAEEQETNPIRNLIMEKSGFRTVIRNFLEYFLKGRAHRSHGDIEDPIVALCGVYFGHSTLDMLVRKSEGQIQHITLPNIVFKEKLFRDADRKHLLNIKHEDDFERFLVETLYYSIPRIFIEYFRKYYDDFSKDIQKRQFTHICTEVWRSFIPVSIYVAIAQLYGKKAIFMQHGCSTQWLLCNLNVIIPSAHTW